MANPDSPWIEIVGYQYEFAHTGVLNALLSDERYAVTVARLLASNASIVSVTDPKPEGRAFSGRRTRADLTARIADRDGEKWLAVETKVDSPVTPEQLRATADHPSEIVLLALGRTSLQLNDGQLRDGPWHIVALARWAETLALLGDLPPRIAEYGDVIAAEAARHRAAIEAAETGTLPLEPEPRGWPLAQWAWISEVAHHAMRTDELAQGFLSQTLRGAPVAFCRDSWSQAGSSDGVHLYFDLVVTAGRRELVIKAAGVQADRDVFFRAALEALPSYIPTRRSPGTRGNSFALCRRGLDNFTPTESTAILLDALCDTRLAAQTL